MSEKSPTNYMNPRDAAQYLSIGKSKLYELVAAGALPRCKVGTRTVFRRDDLDGYMESVWVCGKRR